MKRWLLLALPLVFACTDSTAPAVECWGELKVVTTETRFASDTAVVCWFPPDTLPPVDPPGDDDCDDDHGHGHKRHHKHGHHDHRGHR